MPVFKLIDEIIFPPVDLAEPDGLLAIDGDLSAERLLTAYSQGIFPWYSEGSPIMWWSPDPRLVLFPDEIRVSRSLRQVINKNTFRVTMDEAFDNVIRLCSDVHRRDDGGTWITGEMIDAYSDLHARGYARSVESWEGDKLAGGLYGVSIGSVFFGESMFSLRSNASKVAFVSLVEDLKVSGCRIIDCQVTTGHLKSLGAREIPRSEFMDILRAEKLEEMVVGLSDRSNKY
ncbi:MAG: leucyl/phenylalanyl-tRNA--protein transferase [Nitrospirota bacterium]|nr:MAG: leucyl/phenylalanyl-tRNA--protein transferase [Nitrospirota bacterium]